MTIIKENKFCYIGKNVKKSSALLWDIRFWFFPGLFEDIGKSKYILEFSVQH